MWVMHPQPLCTKNLHLLWDRALSNARPAFLLINARNFWSECKKLFGARVTSSQTCIRDTSAPWTVLLIRTIRVREENSSHAVSNLQMWEKLHSSETNFKWNGMLYKLRAKDCLKKKALRKMGRRETHRPTACPWRKVAPRPRAAQTHEENHFWKPMQNEC